jgi:hypothetical protein
MLKILALLLAAGTALSNSTTETVLASYTLPAYGLQRGQVIQVDADVIAPATNSTDTLTVRMRVGPTTLTGTIVGTSGAVDVANNDVVDIDVDCTVRSTGTAGVVVCAGTVTALGAEGTATARVAFEELTLNTALAQRIEVTGVWSVASASNSCRADAFSVAVAL